MNKKNLTTFPNSETLALAFANHFAQKADEAIRTRGRFLAVLSGGGTPLKSYRLLAQEPFKSQVDWAKVHLFWGDERFVPHDDPQSNFYQAKEALLDHVNIPAENLHPMPTELSPREAVDAYRQVLSSFAEPSQNHIRFDLVLLGLGDDGHTASLFVGQSALWINPIISTEGDYQGRPSTRLTLTSIVINQAREIVFMVSGASKADALANALGDEKDLNRFPSQAISGRVRWIVDEDSIPSS
ncbi:MAG: 6-phosphogluconolactonase [Anaerolineae bacterium]|nr:6-phosphogluconolactonase [Anaerolineae bacterium]MBT7071420.1 6-phosphogluconolactonase [Anaerolineae bacterium]MBT7325506.1 6-phosphogluconolactonase [Anaerolineae bacterium]